MTATDHIRYIKRQQVDLAKWDRCIHESPNGLIYARSFFLDTITNRQWDALVMGDYEAVMPLIWNKKFGFTYLYQPHFLPALGVFNKGTQTASLEVFLTAIPAGFRFWDIDLNERNTLSAATGLSLTSTFRHNYFLPLDRSGEDIRQDYKRLARRMLKKAAGLELNIQRDADPRQVIEWFQKEYDRNLPHISGEVYRRMTVCAQLAQAEGYTAAYVARQPNGTVLAFYLLLRDDKFVYSVMGGSTSAGRETAAFYLLTDAAIQDHCGTHRIFRFEGSDVPGIAFFNAQFGSYPVTYLHLLVNRLPFPIRLLKNKKAGSNAPART